MKRRRFACQHPLKTLTACALAGIGMGTLSSTAQAQVAPGFALNRFEPSETGSEWFANDTLDIRGTVRPALGVIADYAHKPYVLLNADGSENVAVVKYQFFLHLGGSLVLFDRLRLGVTLPIGVAESGSTTGGVVNGQRIVVDAGAGVGDLRAAADLRLAGEYGSAFTLAFGGRIWFPTGSARKYLGDDAIRVGPHLSIAGDAGALGYAATFGVIYRANSETFAGHPTGTEINFGVAAGLRAIDRKLLIGPELSGTSVVSQSGAFLGARTTPLALLGGAHLTAGDFRFGLGAGPGLSHAAGTAAFRALASIEFVPGVAAPATDRDGDGVFDSDDACPDVSGVRTEDPRTNGCPPDRDKDTILDPVDACPDVPGVATDDPKTNGCPPPPPDHDKDGILDPVDACPDVPGIATDDPKTNGCPAPGDRDKDGILDPVDACPDVPGLPNQDPKKNGCPAAFVQENQIRIMEQIHFRFAVAELDPVSDSILDAVLKVIVAHTEIKKIRIEGHADEVGTADFNMRLSRNRADSVAKWLVRHGIDRKKLTVVGYGLERPIDTNKTEEGRANNRRVEFHIEGETRASE